MKRKSTILTTICLIVIVTLLNGCATLFAPDNHEVQIDSEPQGADIYIDGVKTGKTPMETNLKPDKSYMVEFRKDGFQKTTIILDTKVKISWVVLDVFFGLIPVVVDFATGAWNEFDNPYIDVELKPSNQNTNTKDQNKQKK